MTLDPVKLIECPRDAMQGIKDFMPTTDKVGYLNQLLKVGYDTLDFGSFVSPKAIPQMRDTAQVLNGLNLENSKTKLSAIVGNMRGATDACVFEEIDLLGYPFSISETFQIRNTNATLDESLKRVEEIQEMCVKHNKELLLYISMAFGNPYGDPWNIEICQSWIQKLSELGITTMALSDTIGVGTPGSISYLFGNLIPEYPEIEFGAHLHTLPYNWREKVEAAFSNGCLRFDSAIRGFGGCPMAKDDLTGNMPTENLLMYFDEEKIPLNLDRIEFNRSVSLALDVFPTDH